MWNFIIIDKKPTLGNIWGMDSQWNNNYLFQCNKVTLSNWEQIIIRDDSKFDKVTLLQSNT